MQEVIRSTIKLYLYKSLGAKPLLPFLVMEKEDISPLKNRLFQDIDFSSMKEFLYFVDSVELSDVILVPHDYSHIKNDRAYIDDLYVFSKTAGKKLLVFFYSDSTEEVSVQNGIIVRSSAYKTELISNEIIMPAYVEGLHKLEIEYRKKGDVPVVGFAGQAEFRDVKHMIIFFIKNYFFLWGNKKEGIYFRRKLIRVFKQSVHVTTSFIIRNFYSGNKKSLRGDVQGIRNEYLNNIINGDFVLAPKGDGNYSLRFYETLALGRTPILLDTDMQLPLEEYINYNEFIFKVGVKDISNSPLLLKKFWDSLSVDDLKRIETQGRGVFAKYLYMPSFLKILFSKEYLDKYL